MKRTGVKGPVPREGTATRGGDIISRGGSKKGGEKKGDDRKEGRKRGGEKKGGDKKMGMKTGCGSKGPAAKGNIKVKTTKKVRANLKKYF